MKLRKRWDVGQSEADWEMEQGMQSTEARWARNNAEGLMSYVRQLEASRPNREDVKLLVDSVAAEAAANGLHAEQTSERRRALLDYACGPEEA